MSLPIDLVSHYQHKLKGQAKGEVEYAICPLCGNYDVSRIDLSKPDSVKIRLRSAKCGMCLSYSWKDPGLFQWFEQVIEFQRKMR